MPLRKQISAYTMARGILLTLLCIAIGSCGDYFELQPEVSLVQDKYWKTQEDVEAVLMGAYAEFAQLDDDLFLLGELRGDMLTGTKSTYASMSNIMNGNITPSNYYCKWAQFYKVINLCNYVLEFAEDAREYDLTFSEVELKNFMAEAYFLRSLTYFYLVRIFKDVPLVLRSARTDDQDFFNAKSTDAEILTQIKSDLSQTRVFAPDFFESEREMKGRATKAAVYALLADICLWNFEYEECIRYCDYIIEEKADNYTLVQRSQWYSMYYPGNSAESIFEIQYDEGRGQANHLYRMLYNPVRLVTSLYAQEILLPVLSGENIRGSGTIRETNKTIWKYQGSFSGGKSSRPSTERSSSNWIIYRMSDVILMKAEALSQIGTEEAYEKAFLIINTIRERAGVPQVETIITPSGAEDAVLMERLLELAYEGKRWFDLLRMGRRNNYARKSELIQILINNVPSAQRLILKSKLNDPYGWYLPIHVDELNANLNLVQNPFYSSFSD